MLKNSLGFQITEQVETSSTESLETIDEAGGEAEMPSTSAELPGSLEATASAPASPLVHPLDFGNVFNIGIQNLSDEQRFKFLTEFYTPPAEPASAWPTETRMTRSGPSLRRLRPDHLQRPEARCLAYSPALGGFFCRYCALFLAETDSQRHHFVNQRIALVHEPLKRFSRMFGKDGYVTTHVQREYHQFSSERAEAFLSAMRTPGSNIQERLQQEEIDRLENRRKILRPMIKTILVLGRCGLAFRGHRDSGPIIVPESSVAELQPDEGNFRTLLGYRAMYDSSLAEHLRRGGRNAQYSSSKIQNEVIGITGKLIQKSIVDSVKQARYFSVLADETSDVARMEQLSISVRFVSEDENGKACVEEKFLTFVEAADCTGPALAELIMKTLTECGLELRNLVGQNYDGATSMSGIRGGVQSQIRQHYPCALYVHCCAHVLNLILMKSSAVVPIRHTFGVMTKVSSFFRTSPKRTLALKDAIERTAPESQRRTLRSLCETRWVERAEACLSFKSLFIPVVAALSNLSEAEPEGYSYAVGLSEERFMFALCLMSVTMGALKTLSEQLQSPSNTLPKALEQQKLLLQQLRMWFERDEGIGRFSRVQAEYRQLCQDMRAMDLGNFLRERDEMVGAEELKTKIYDPFLTGLIDELNQRFSPHYALASKIRLLLPSLVKETTFEDFKETFGFYEEILPHQDLTLFETEYEAWKCKWAQAPPLEDDLLQTLDGCDASFFPIIRALLQVLATLPVSTGTLGFVKYPTIT